MTEHSFSLQIYNKTATDLIVSASADGQSRLIPGISLSADPLAPVCVPAIIDQFAISAARKPPSDAGDRTQTAGGVPPFIQKEAPMIGTRATRCLMGFAVLAAGYTQAADKVGIAARDD